MFLTDGIFCETIQITPLHAVCCVYHRRRIKIEEKAKVVASVWVKFCFQFLAALAVLPWTILINRKNCTRMI